MVEPKQEIWVPESARKDKKHQHDWKIESMFMDGSGFVIDCATCPLQRSITKIEIERCLSALDAMKQLEDGIYLGSQFRDYLIGINELPITDSS